MLGDSHALISCIVYTAVAILSRVKTAACPVHKISSTFSRGRCCGEPCLGACDLLSALHYRHSNSNLSPPVVADKRQSHWSESLSTATPLHPQRPTPNAQRPRLRDAKRLPVSLGTVGIFFLPLTLISLSLGSAPARQHPSTATAVGIFSEPRLRLGASPSPPLDRDVQHERAFLQTAALELDDQVSASDSFRWTKRAGRRPAVVPLAAAGDEDEGAEGEEQRAERRCGRGGEAQGAGGQRVSVEDDDVE